MHLCPRNSVVDERDISEFQVRQDDNNIYIKLGDEDDDG